MKYILFSLITLLTFVSSAQVSISDTAAIPDPSSVLDVKSNTKGMLIPRMSIIERDAIVNPAHALMVYQLDEVNGFYYNSGTPLAPLWSLVGAKDCQGRSVIDTLPFTISTSGSYYLSDYLLGSPGMDGIIVNASNVTVDFNGFGIDGNSHSGNNGIILMAGSHHVTFYNGTISNWNNDGIKGDNSDHVLISGVKSRSNNYEGIAVGDNAILKDCISSSNGFDGFDIGSDGVMESCIANNNSSDGIEMDEGASILNCTASNNTSNGFNLDNNTIITNSTATHNLGNGVFIEEGANVSLCNSNQNSSHGYHIGANSIIRSNTASNNGGDGFYSVASYSRLESNHAISNTNGFKISGTNVMISKNTSGNNTTNWNIAAGNLFGSIITSATFNTNTNPNANISQ